MNSTVPPRDGYVTDSFAYEYDVMSATAPATMKATGTPPCASCTANPSTANMPPPTMPPTPMAAADQNPIGPSALPLSLI